jgi:glycosyltransferase involved in cell wall biosynthesis
MGFVCTFRGRRDSYQVPLALAECGMLDAFLTDFYMRRTDRGLAAYLTKSYRSKLSSRYEHGLESTQVRQLRITAICEAISRKLGKSADWIYDKFDPIYGIRAANLAYKLKSDLFVYSPHAWEAFSSCATTDCRKILFQFHPHFKSESEILANDAREYAKNGAVFEWKFESGEHVVSKSRMRSDSAWQVADSVVCASSFTLKTLLREGADVSKIRVQPYGVDSLCKDGLPNFAAKRGPLRALFVGSGIQRKGLHHLLMSWNSAKLPKDSLLTIISRNMDPGLKPLLAKTKNIIVHSGMDAADLDRTYREASLFVMPSLIEGFGQVYLEALSYGLPVLGTENTCLNDLGDESDGVFITPVSQVENLTANLERLAEIINEQPSIHQAARNCAEKFTWRRFRQGISEHATSLGRKK